jgi:hypothetical protein
MTTRLSQRFPPGPAIAPVFAWLVVLIFSYALYQFFWYTPSWLAYRTPGDILAIASYVLGLALLESLILMGGLLVVAALLPARLLREHFAAQGALLVWAAAGWAMLILAAINHDLAEINYLQDQFFGGEILFGLVLLALIVLSLVFAPYFAVRRFRRFERGVLALGQRITVFLYIYVPLGMLGLAVVTIRNIR